MGGGIAAAEDSGKLERGSRVLGSRNGEVGGSSTGVVVAGNGMTGVGGWSRVTGAGGLNPGVTGVGSLNEEVTCVGGLNEGVKWDFISARYDSIVNCLPSKL